MHIFKENKNKRHNDVYQYSCFQLYSQLMFKNIGPISNDCLAIGIVIRVV